MSLEQGSCGSERRQNDVLIALHTNLKVGKPNTRPGLQLLRDSSVFQIFYFDLDPARNNLIGRCLIALSLFFH